ncbi:50S ribosomal protein L7ae-like protein [Siminovitchia sediminis]|uniref:RNA-binding protein ACFSCZ_17375 n=1 Tax=Siminovitchia sediminis TaxID=1274353 RepID=A0ABW4KMH6_9BACI
MSYEKVLQDANVVIGTKQTVRALKSGDAKQVFIAEDAEPRVTGNVIQTAQSLDIPVTKVDSMKKLGRACGIDVGAAAVAIIH